METPLRKNVPGLVFAGLCVASAAVAARSHDSATAVVLRSEEIQGSVRSVASVTGKWERLLFLSGRE